MAVLFPISCLLSEPLPFELSADLWAGQNGGLVFSERHDEGICHRIVRQRNAPV